MEFRETRQRREAARALATVRRRGAAERRASDERLRREVRDAFSRQRAGKLDEDRQFGVEPNHPGHGREAVTSYDTEEGPKGPGARNVSPV